MPFCEDCQAEGAGTVCSWCGRTYDAAASVVRATAGRWAKWWWALTAITTTIGIVLALPHFGATASAIRGVKSKLPGAIEGMESQGHRCRFTVTDANEPGREGWRIVRCLLNNGNDGPAWYLARTQAVYAQNTSAKTWSKAADPPEIPAWTQPGNTCSMSDYYDDCMADLVARRVRRVSYATLEALQTIADQTLSFPPGHSREVAAKVQKCGITSFEARCGQFTREMRAVEDEVLRQIAVQKSP